jgi:hypothetical protein
VSSDICLDDDSILTVPGHVLSRKAGGEAVLLNLDSEEYYGLDGVGSRLWDLLEDGTTFGQVIDTLSDEYDVESDVLKVDLRAVLGDLVEQGLVLLDAA